MPARPVPHGYFEQRRDFRREMRAKPSQNLIGRESAHARAPDRFLRKLTARRHGVRDAGETRLRNAVAAIGREVAKFIGGPGPFGLAPMV